MKEKRHHHKKSDILEHDKTKYSQNTKNEVELSDDDQIEGKNSVLEALRSGRPINKLLIATGENDSSIKRIIDLAQGKGIVFQHVEKSKLDRMSQSRSHQGVIALTAPKEYVEPDEILEIAKNKDEDPFIIILDGITDHNNLGSIIRTAECAGSHGMIIPKRRSASINTTVSKVSAGAVEHLPVARVTNLSRTIQWLKEKGVWVVGTDSSATQDFYDADYKGPIALVIGSEGEGISRLVRESCDFLVNIPMKGYISSLNAGVAAGIVMYEVAKQRKTSNE